uniref:Uncharacterized protein n=1 Tax=Plectus sambesii TaxID=2011161 RepID=A0A914X4E5_9BILA
MGPLPSIGRRRLVDGGGRAEDSFLPTPPPGQPFYFRAGDRPSQSITLLASFWRDLAISGRRRVGADRDRRRRLGAIFEPPSVRPPLPPSSPPPPPPSPSPLVIHSL